MINEYCTFAFVANIHTTSFDRFNSTVRLILLNQILSISKHYGEFTILPYQNIEKNFLRRPPPPSRKFPAPQFKNSMRNWDFALPAALIKHHGECRCTISVEAPCAHSRGRCTLGAHVCSVSTPRVRAVSGGGWVERKRVGAPSFVRGTFARGHSQLTETNP